MSTMVKPMDLERRYSAHNYEPLPVVLVRGEGVYVWDDAGKRYLDMMSAYSAVSHGHCHPKLVKVLQEQATKLNVVSRAARERFKQSASRPAGRLSSGRYCCQSFGATVSAGVPSLAKDSSATALSDSGM